MNILSLNIRGFGEGGKIRRFKKLRRDYNPVIVHLQETKCGNSSESWLENLWGSPDFKFIQKDAIGSAGGMITIWDTRVFDIVEATEGEYYLAIRGYWKGKSEEMAFVNIYGPHTNNKKTIMWDNLDRLVKSCNMPWVLCGDFNEVRCEDERFNCIFNKARADKFNHFISSNCLIDLPLCGKKYKRYSDNGVKFAKLDRFLISENFNNNWPGLNAAILDHNLSDHCPIILRDGIIDFGPKPTKVFNVWLILPGAEEIIATIWNTKVHGNRPDRVLYNKLKMVKQELKNLNLSINGKLDEEIQLLIQSTKSWETIADSRALNEIEQEAWITDRKKWIEKD
ncbi:uncharacterized protein [Rutidosis leptorrhynchoides]|uniref:uncharacterized protein n=1 Tax=Rutidosis leptorrhynchoides TaxID=125765 RepID=UPI003A99703F